MSLARTGEGPSRHLNVALTGATGFIGCELQRQLLADGHTLRALVRPDSPNRARIAPGASAIELTLDDTAALTRALQGCDAVIYCAGSVRGSAPADFRAANVDGVHTLAGAIAAQAAPPRVLLISSLAASRPELSDYARSKFEGEEILRAHPDIAWTILRPPAVYGPGDVEMRPLLRAIRCGLALIVGPPAQRLSLLHVADLAAAVVAWLGAGVACHRQTYAIDDGRAGGYGWPDIIAAARGALPVLPLRVPPGLLAILARANLALARHRRRPPMLTPGKVRELSEPSWLCNNSAFTADTGWLPRIALDEGVVQALQKE